MRLIVHRGGQALGERIVDKDSIRIGRLRSCDLPLEDDGVARFHAVIEEGANGLSIVDMGSPGGTFVQGKPICRAALAYGDEIRIGSYRIRIERGGEPEVISEAEIVDEQPLAQPVQPAGSVVESRPDDGPSVPEMVLVPLADDLIAAPVAKVIWSATPEEMAQEPATGEIDVRGFEDQTPIRSPGAATPRRPPVRSRSR